MASRILIVSDAWHPQVNGVVRTLEATRAEAEALGHTIEIIGPDRFVSVPLPSYPEIRLAVLPRIGRLIEAFAPDAIHIATEAPLGWAARRYCLKQELPFTTAIHTRFPEYMQKHVGVPVSWTYRWLRQFHRPATASLVPTWSLMAEFEQHGFQNLKLWGRGVDTNLFQSYSEDMFARLKRPIFLSVGRIALEKNIRAFLNLDLPGSKVVIGDGPQLAELRRDYPDAIFLGCKSGAALAQAYSSADVFVFPSLTDTFGLVLLEALACGTPIAAFPVTGPRDILQPQSPTAPVGVMDTDLRQAALAALALNKPVARCQAFVQQHYNWRDATIQFLSHQAALSVVPAANLSRSLKTA